MIPKLVWENVRFRPIRTLLSIMLIAGPVTLILSLIGVSRGFLDDSKKRAAGVGADIIFRPKDSSFASFSGTPLPDKLVAVLAARPHVAMATGTAVMSLGGFDTLTGIDPEAFRRMSGGFTFRKGGTFQRADDVLVDDLYASQHKLTAGSTLHVMNRDWHVAGVVEQGKMSHIFAQLGVLQEAMSAPGKLSQVYIKVDRPENVAAVLQDLKTTFEGYPIYDMKEWLSLISADSIPYLGTFINIVIGIGVIFGFIVVLLSMYMAVLQRTREIGILKSMGATKGFVMRLILWEAFLLGLGGTFLGILLSFGVRALMSAIVPASLPVAIVLEWWPRAALIAMGAAVFGALYPGLLAVRQDPIEALANE